MERQGLYKPINEMQEVTFYLFDGRCSGCAQHSVSSLTETRDSYKHVVKIAIEKVRDMSNINTPSKFKDVFFLVETYYGNVFLKFLAVFEIDGKTIVTKGNRSILKMFIKIMPYYFQTS